MSDEEERNSMEEAGDLGGGERGEAPEAGDAEPLSVEPVESRGGDAGEEAPASKSGVRALDVCPNCGAPMRNTGTLVCMECGFDLKKLKVIKTELGETSEGLGEEDAREALVKRGVGDPWLGPALAVGATVVLAIGYVVGTRGLFDVVSAGEGAPSAGTVAWNLRLLGLVQLPLLIGLGTLCGLGALTAGAWLFGKRLGNVNLALARLVGVVALARLVSFIDVGRHPWELVLEAAGQAAVFFVLSMVLFRLKPRDGTTLLGLVILAVVVLYALARAVTWVLQPLS